jgi:hypothetical protein
MTIHVKRIVVYSGIIPISFLMLSPQRGESWRNFRRGLNGSIPLFSHGALSSEGFSEFIDPFRFLAR